MNFINDLNKTPEERLNILNKQKSNGNHHDRGNPSLKKSTSLNSSSIQNFRKNVNVLFEIDEDIKELRREIEPLQKKLKYYKDRKKFIQKMVCDFMINNNIDECNIKEEDAKIKYTHAEYSKALTLDALKDLLVQFYKEQHEENDDFKFGNYEEKGMYLFNYIKVNKPKNSKDVLRKLKYKEVTEYEEYEELE